MMVGFGLRVILGSARFAPLALTLTGCGSEPLTVEILTELDQVLSCQYGSLVAWDSEGTLRLSVKSFEGEVSLPADDAGVVLFVGTDQRPSGGFCTDTPYNYTPPKNEYIFDGVAGILRTQQDSDGMTLSILELVVRERGNEVASQLMV